MSTVETMGGTCEKRARALNGPLKRVTFEVRADPGASVFVVGSFNDWDPVSCAMKPAANGFYKATLKLPSGRHEYKFVVNGEWQADPRCQTWVPNALGTLNSVVEVP